MSDINLAWLAGLLEGEGSFISSAGRVMIALEMTDEDIVRRVQTLTGVGGVWQTTKRQAHHKQAWRWAAQGQAEVKELLETLLPLMGQRRTIKIIECLAAIAQRSAQHVANV